MLTPNEPKNIWKKVTIENGCWIRHCGYDQDGYVQFKLRGQNLRGHRVAYELLKGKIPEGLTLDHLCKRRNCINPNHLEPVTIAVNTMRGDSPAAKNITKTTCKNGHLLDDSNTYHYTRKSGRPRRDCRRCRNDAVKRYQERT